MSTTLNIKPKENGTYVITVSFYDENGDPVTPNVGLSWSLFDWDGAVVNDRDQEELTPATSVTFVLSGLDLALAADDDQRRVLLVEGTYNSTLGSNLPLLDEAIFEIVDLRSQ